MQASSNLVCSGGSTGVPACSPISRIRRRVSLNCSCSAVKVRLPSAVFLLGQVSGLRAASASIVALYDWLSSSAADASWRMRSAIASLDALRSDHSLEAEQQAFVS